MRCRLTALLALLVALPAAALADGIPGAPRPEAQARQELRRERAPRTAAEQQAWQAEARERARQWQAWSRREAARRRAELGW